MNCVDNPQLKARFSIVAFPTVLLFSPRYEMHAQFAMNNKFKWEDALPPWARDNAQEWERLASRANTEMLTTLTFEARVLESQPAWLVMYAGGSPAEKHQSGVAKPNFLRLGSDLHGRVRIRVGGEAVILLHPPLPSVGVSIGMETGVQHNDSLVDG